MSPARTFSAGVLTFLLAPAALVGVIGVAAAWPLPIPATRPDFFQPGTQPGTLRVNIMESVNCSFCHGYYDEPNEPYRRWAASMMGQAARDPIFWACLAVANQDVAHVGDICLRCHAPVGWLEGRSIPEDGSALIAKDRDSVTCHVCHRMVDPIYTPENPPEDPQILRDVGQVNPDPHTGQYVIDPEDRRRGPFDLGKGFPWHPFRHSPYHRESLLCANCHDVSNPAFTRQPDGSYRLGPLGQPHPTHNKYDEFPLERTYSEWAASAFARGPIDMGGRFGGNQRAVSTCQDCHMPRATGRGCYEALDPPIRDDLPRHNFNGSNSWVLRAVRSLFPDSETGLSEESVSASIQRNVEMLQLASDLEVAQRAGMLEVRVINQTGHKLPTGYPEGRRMWINVRFLDRAGQLVREHGAYDPTTATLVTSDTKVYHAELGLDEYMSQQTGLPAGPSFHFALNNRVFFDNRIPPRGFTNEGFRAVQAEPVGYSYSDGQYWDVTRYSIPRGAVQAVVRVFHQTTSREYIEFLRDANHTNQAGQVAYQQWVAHGRSPPVEMDSAELALRIPGDLDQDGDVDQSDLAILLADWGCVRGPGHCPGDIDGDGDTDQADLGMLLVYWGS